MSALQRLLTMLLSGIIFAPFVYAAAPSKIEQILVLPSRVFIATSGQTVTAKAELSPEKTMIRAVFPNTMLGENSRQLFGKGNIADITGTREGKNTVLYIQLNKKQGFTLNLLPYSGYYVLDVFSWETLSVPEELLRNGLLAAEDDNSEIASPYFRKAAQSGSSDGAAYLGFSLVRSGHHEEAEQWLKTALERHCELPDIHAALCQIMRTKNNVQEARKHEKLFAEQTGGRPVFDVAVEYSPLWTAESMENAEPMSMANSLSENIGSNLDSVYAQHDSTAVVNDRFASLFRQDSSAVPVAAANDTSIVNASLMPVWLKTASLAVGSAVIAGFFLLVAFYIRWRNKRRAEDEETENHAEESRNIEQNDTPPKAVDFQHEFEKAQTTPGLAEFAENAYRKSARFDTIIDDDKPQEQTVAPTEQRALRDDESLMERFLHDMTKKGKSGAGKLRKSLASNERTPTGKTGAQERANNTARDYRFVPNGEWELAMRLHERQQSSKALALQEMDADTIPNATFGAAKFAKRFGVERGSIEIKRSIENFQRDAQALNSIRKKFETAHKRSAQKTI